MYALEVLCETGSWHIVDTIRAPMLWIAELALRGRHPHLRGCTRVREMRPWEVGLVA